MEASIQYALYKAILARFGLAHLTTVDQLNLEFAGILNGYTDVHVARLILLTQRRGQHSNTGLLQAQHLR